MELFTDNGVVRAIVVRSRRSPAIPLVVKKKKKPIYNSTIPPPLTETAVPVQLST